MQEERHTPLAEGDEAQEEQKDIAPVQWRPQDADREHYKASIRNRVRNARVTEGTVFIPAKPKPAINDAGEKQVAVYARVSTKSTEQVSSIENQTRYYTEKIGKTPNWHMHRIYSDEGKSGTSMKRRLEFQQMLQDAADKKMDLILCASVSRFARNVSDCIRQVRMLRTLNPSHPVGVYFETENIYTLDPESNQSLSIHAMLAEWESANKSRRMILSYDQRICTGQYPVADLLGFRHTLDGDLIIQEDEAKTVRFAFLARFCGMEYKEVAAIFTDKQRPTLHGRTEWNENMVRTLLKNERRWGDLNARKRIIIDYTERKSIKNNNERDAAYVTGHHTGIVTAAIAKAVRMVDASRGSGSGVRDIGVIEHGGLKGFVSISPTWNGIDADTFIEISRSVYTDEELELLQKAADIRNGEAHTNMLSMSFTGYEVPPSAYFIGRKTPTITISQRKITFNKACFSKLDGCTHFEMLYHPILQAIVIRSCDAEAANAICIEDMRRNESYAPFAAYAFSTAIYEKMNWMPEYDFRFRGIYRERGDYRAVMFYLDEPQILVGKHAKKLQEKYEVDESGAACFIPYQNTRQVAYPSQWENRPIGISYALRKQRDRLVDDITADDISQAVTVVENPLIGAIPTRDEALAEIQELLLSM